MLLVLITVDLSTIYYHNLAM